MTSHAQRASAPVAFHFQQSYTVRVIVIQGEPWFCLRDVATVLEIPRTSDLLQVQKGCGF